MELSGRVMLRNSVVAVALAASLASTALAGTGAPRKAPHCVAGTRPLTVSATVAFAGTALRPTRVHASPGGRVIARFGLENANGAPTVFGILGERVGESCRVGWLHVELPMRPNESTGWIRASDVERRAVHTRITVDLARLRVRVYRFGRLVLTTRAAVGSSATPTPRGRYYVDQRLVPSDPNGPFGPGAVGLSAFSPVLTGWTQGGPVAIHGTNEPWSIGRRVSNGCIRVPNPVLRRLFRLAVTGTPVLIVR
jgi:lipoprotein-anchoring transpeptidase ErfK/SrfK